MRSHALVPCHYCDDRVPIDAMHDLHRDTCPVRVAQVERREPTDDEYAECFCPERLVCASCCPVCSDTENPQTKEQDDG